ncbi:MAG TPA: metal ABC transporter permease [Actinomycetota bacterium]
MPWPFDRGYMQLALYSGVVVGAVAPMIGTFLVQKRLSLMGDGIGHVALAGVAAGLLAGVWPIWTALVIAVLAALGIQMMQRRGVAGDLALALVFYAGIAAAAVIAQLARSLDASFIGYLFGSVFTVAPSEVWLIAGLGVVIVVAIAVTGPALFAIVVDEESARVAGLPVDRLNALLAILVALTIVVAMRVVGVLLVAALMVLPVGASQVLARSFRATILGASAVGVGSVVVGLTLARAQGDLQPGGTIVLVAAAAFVIATLLSRRPRAVIGASPVDQHLPVEHHH